MQKVGWNWQCGVHEQAWGKKVQWNDRDRNPFTMG